MECSEEDINNAFSNDISDEEPVINNITFWYNLSLLNIFFNYLVVVADYDNINLLNIWSNNNRYLNTIVKPPWYENGMGMYLADCKIKGLIECVKWIRSY